MPIVTSTYRYKRPPRKRKPVAIKGPAIVTSVDPKKSRRAVRDHAAAGEVMSETHPTVGDIQPSTAPVRQRHPAVITAEKATAPANDDGHASRRS
jgi:hypothetical protein